MALYQNKKTKKWAYRLSHIDENGERKQKHSKWFNLKKEAKEAEKKYLESVNDNISNDSITFEDIWSDYISLKKERLKITSFESIKKKEKHFKNLFKLKIVDFDIKEYNKWKKGINKKNYSTTHKNNIYKCLRSALRHGKKYFDINIDKLLVQMTNFTNPNELKKEMKFFTYEDFNKFISVENDLTYKVFFETLYFCGLRLGETLALNWTDIEYVSDDLIRIKVSKTLTEKIKGEKYVILPPKTKSSNRILPIKNKKLILGLKQIKEKAMTLYGFEDKWFIFGNVYPLAETTLQKRKNDNCKKAGVQRIRIHDFRHSCASLLINKGASIALVSRYLGHTDIATTLNIYSHMFKSELEDIAIELSDL